MIREIHSGLLFIGNAMDARDLRPSIGAAVVATLTGRNPDDCLVDIIADGPSDVSPILWARVKSVYGAMDPYGKRE